jgi:beta-N-acetylhexosaminidase
MQMRILFSVLFVVPLFLSAQRDSLDIKIGQMLIMGLDNFQRLDPSEPMFLDIRDGLVGNVILYAKHIDKENPESSLRAITNHIQELAPIPLFIGIDEEGGRVNRLKPAYGFPRTLSAQRLGFIHKQDCTQYYARQSAETMARLGINMNFAPSLDVNVNPQNPVIGGVERSYSENEAIVAQHGAWMIAAQKEWGIVNVVKHFPGHGSSTTDSHYGMADVSDSWQSRELYPFQKLIQSNQAQAIMTAHIVNAQLDENKLPATLSKRMVHDLLRSQWGYDGVVISDDMQMHAISKFFGLEEAIIMAINAGVDMIMFANNIELSSKITATELHGIIKKNVIEGRIPLERIDESFRRIMALKQANL